MKRLRLSVQPLESRCVPASFTVLNLNDAGPDSLRDCVSKANAAAGADTIAFQVGLAGLITLTSGELPITDALAVQGPGAAELSVSGNNAGRIFNITAPFLSNITISGLTLTNGKAADGGAVVCGDVRLTLADCVLTNNTATGNGGAVKVGFNFTATGCTFSGNSAGVKAGAVAVSPSGFSGMTFRSCSFSGNKAPVAGGIYANNFLLVENTTLSGNSATTQHGGGILVAGYAQPGNLVVRNSTISGNSANTDGGGIALINTGSRFDVQNCTITDNTASKSGGGISRPGGYGVITLESSIVSGNTAATAQDIFNKNFDVNQKTSAVGDGIGFFKVDQGGNLPFGPHAALHLLPLADNGGPMKTHQLGPNSPLKDIGSNPAGLTNEQRGPGFPRVAGAGPDIGAVEGQGYIPRVVTNALDAGPGSLRQVIADANAAAGADLITFDPVFNTSVLEIRLLTGEIAINDSVTIAGPAGRVIINGNAAGRLFNTSGAPRTSDVVLQNLVLTNGKVAGATGGGVLADDEHLTLQNCVANKFEALLGGVVHSKGRLLIDDCAFSDSEVGDDAGAVGAYGQELAVRRSTFTNTNAFFSGGGIAASVVSGRVLIEDCTFTGNYAYDGGAISSDTGPGVVIRRCTISKNQAGHRGGAIELKASSLATIEDCQISDNTAARSGGAINVTGNSTLVVRGSTLANNTAGPGTFQSPATGGAIRGNHMVIEDSTLTGNKCTSADSLGGAILMLVSGSVTVRRSTLSNNSATNGGAIFAEHVLIEDSTLSGNQAGAGGALYVEALAADVTIRRSTLKNNVSQTSGGAIYAFNVSLNNPVFTLEDSTLSGNSAITTDSNAGGGAIYWLGNTSGSLTLTARNCTFSGNIANGSGGAVCLVTFKGTASFQNTTITNNIVANFGGGIARISGTSVPTLSSTIVAGNTANFGPDAVTFSAGNFTGNNNLIGVSEGFTLSGMGNLIGTKATPLNAKLGPLLDNGGPTFTHLPLAGSPAINAGNNAAGLSSDQRGSPRVSGAAADIGSFEVQPITKIASVIVNNGAAQRSRVTSLKVVFTQPPNYASTPANAFQLTRQSDNATVSGTATASGVNVTFSFTGGPIEFGSLADGRYTLTALASQITNLDGDNNGTVGGNFVLTGTPANGLFRLFGDNDGDGDVDATDFGQFRLAFGTTANLAFDFDNDGDVDAADFGQFRQRFGTSV